MAIQRPFKYTLLLILLVIPLIIFGSILVLDSERDEKLLKVQDFVLQNIGNVLGSRINPGKGSRISVKKTGPISPWSWQASLQNCTEKTRDSNFIPFNNERMAKWTITDAGIADLQREWKSHIDAYVDQPTPENGTRTTRGYLYTARSKNVQILQLSLKSLRRFTNDSVEVWHDDDLHSNYISSLESDFPPLKVFNLKDFNIPHLEAIDDGRKYQVKGAAIIHTKLDKVLLLDSDNVPLVEPSFLFDSPAFTETGAVFWPDYWKTLPDNPIWKIMDLECADEFEQESGQLLVDKAFPGVNRALHLAFFLQTRSSTYYSYLLGDKDTFRHAFRSLNQPYHMIRANVNPVSSPQEIEFSGHSMLQFAPFWGENEYGPAPEGWKDPDHPAPLFMHCNILKYATFKPHGETRFENIQRFKNGVTRNAVTRMKGSELSLAQPEKGIELVAFESLVPGFNDLFDKWEGSRTTIK